MAGQLVTVRVANPTKKNPKKGGGMTTKKKNSAKKNPRRRRRARANPKRRRRNAAVKAAAPAKRSNPKRSNPKRRRHARKANAAAPRRRRRRRRNPGIPAAVMHAGKAVLGGALAAGVGLGATMLLQKWPPRSKAAAIAMPAIGGMAAGGILGALGFQAAGTLVASSMGTAAFVSAFTQPQGAAQTQGNVSGLLETDANGNIRGLVEPQSRDAYLLAEARNHDAVVNDILTQMH
jgi:hypothetical protein